jgi:hypothetical protein
MVNKQTLVSIISKYYLNGLNNQVKWRIKDKILTIYAGEAGKVCKIELKNINLEDAELGIFDTNKLSKLLSITYGDLIISLEKQKSIFTKLNISDQNYNLTYSLADVLILGKQTYYKDQGNYNIKLNLDKEHINNLIKAKNALLDVDNMLITTKLDLDNAIVCEFIFGDNTGFSNKITYQIYGDIDKENLELPFNSDIFRDILNANKDMDHGLLQISENGIMKINFSSEEIESEYYLARNE